MTAPAATDEALWKAVREALDQFVADAVTSCVPAPIVRAMQSPDAHLVDTTVNGVPTSIPVPAGRLTPNEIVSAWQDLRASIVAEQLEAVS